MPRSPAPRRPTAAVDEPVEEIVDVHELEDAPARTSAPASIASPRPSRRRAGQEEDEAATNRQVPDLGGLLDSFQQVQAAREAVYEGTAGGGAVVVRASGDLQFEAVTIEADVVDPSDVAMLEDLVLAALHDLSQHGARRSRRRWAALGGLDLGGLISALPSPAAPRRRSRRGLMAVYAPPVQELIDEFGRLPGIGPKSAQRIAFHLLKLSPEDADRLARSITDAKAT